MTFMKFMEYAQAILLKKPLIRSRTHRRTDLGQWGLDVKDGRISVDGLDAVGLVQRYGSPLFVVNARQLERDIADAKSAMAQAPPGSRILYSYKTNCTPGILQYIHMHGIGAEVVSPYELWLAKSLGVDGSEIIYNGVCKSEESIEMSIRLGILAINIDHIEEIDRIYRIARKLDRKVRVGIRLGLNGSQFGLDLDSGEAIEAARRISRHSDLLELVCVHFNVTSNAKNAYTHSKHAVLAVDFIARIRKEVGVDVRYLDIGGGFGVPTTKNLSGLEYGLYRLTGVLPESPSSEPYIPVDRVIAEVTRTVEECCQFHGIGIPSLIIEPGRLLTSRCEMLLSGINTIKKKTPGPTYVITDFGRLSLAFPCDFEYHEIVLANRANEDPTHYYNIVGRICTSADWVVKNKYLPELKISDVVAIMDAGAYFSSYSSNFSFPRPSIVMVENGRSFIIRSEETYEHLTAMDSFATEENLPLAANYDQ